jgi:hypothetical protein
MSTGQRRLTELPRAESLRLLGTVGFGRVVFTHDAMPAVRPVNHLVIGADIIIRSHYGAAIVTAARAGTGVIVCYEADAIDPATQLGWTVVATGPATLVDDPHPAARYRQALEPWVAVAGAMDEVIRIRPGIITGFRVDGDIKPTLNGG